MSRRISLALAVALAAALLAVPSPADALPTGIRYVTRQAQVNPNSRGSLKAPCPKGTKVLGGGQTISGGNSFNTMASSSPFDSGDANKKPDNGWLGVMNNPTANQRTMTTYAVCAKANPTYVKSVPYVLQAGDNDGPAFACPGEMVPTGGGGAISTKSLDIRLQATEPWSDTISPTPDDGWNARAFNDTGVLQRITTHIICVAPDPAFSFITDSPVLPPSAASQAASISCQPGERVIGGGGNLPGIATVDLNSTGFSDLDGDGLPESWTTRYSNSGGADSYAPISAICMTI